MRVFVYWNLHKGLWSVKALEGPNKGRVIFRSSEVLLTDAVGKVYEAGRQRVLQERKKNVHAGIVGNLSLARDGRDDVITAVEWIGDKITYNPYKYESFVHTVDESRFEGAAYALLTAGRAVYVA
jgi:hypothetical protein